MAVFDVEWHGFPTRLWALTLAAAFVLAGCASRRHFERTGNLPGLATANTFYVVVNGATEKIEYNYLKAAVLPTYATLDYEDYTKSRTKGEVKLDVPVEIVKALGARGKNASLGPAELAPRESAVIISYDELWGWDMRPIIKALTIRATSARGGTKDEASVKFEEMTFFNTQPVASSVVPPMIEMLLEAHGANTLAGAD